MTDQHRATDSEWHCLKARTCGDKSDQVAYSTIHELLHRIEALEVAAKPNHPAKPDSSLVERVAISLAQTWDEMAANTIREVAAWLREHYGGPTATSHLLEQEAER